MMSHQQKVYNNRAVLRSRIEEAEAMIEKIEARSDLGENLKAVAAEGLRENVAEYWKQYANGWIGAWG